MRTSRNIWEWSNAMPRIDCLALPVATSLLLVMCVGCEDPSGPVPSEFEVVDLGAYAPCESREIACRSEAYDVNDAGQVIGMYPVTSGWDSYAFIWHEGSVLDIGNARAANDINDSGQVVGPDGLWENGVWSDLGDLYALAINDLGEIAGFAAYVVGLTEWGDSAYERHATVLSVGVLTDLGTLGGTWSEPSAVNDMSQVVGWSATGEGGLELGEEVHAFLWENGVMIDLGGFGGDVSYAMDINNSGQVVGWTANGNGWYATVGRAFLWEDGSVTELETLGGSVAHAFGINDVGEIVGGSTTASGEYHAVLWQDGDVVDLGTLPEFAVSAAAAINNNGTIVGYCEAPGVRRATMWRRR